MIKIKHKNAFAEIQLNYSVNHLNQKGDKRV